MNTLYFEKLSQFDRVAEPVTVSVPLAQGALCDPQCLVVYDGEHLLAVQRRALAPQAQMGILGIADAHQPHLLPPG